MSVNNNTKLFREMGDGEREAEVTIIESLCMECGKNGITKLFLTKIPYYKDVVIMSFDCEHCGFKNNEIQDAGKVAEKGIKIILTISSADDLNRQVVKSDYTSVQIPHLEFEIPAQSQKGEVTTIEGILDRSIRGLVQDQSRRREENPEAAEQIDQFVLKLEALKKFEEPFTIIFEDISGNCFIQNPNAPQKDLGCVTNYFKRTETQNHIMGIYAENEDSLLHPIKEGEFALEEFENEVMTFPTNCPECNSVCETNMKMTNIPHFKEVIIMATVCDACGHRTNEVKSGAGTEPEGVIIEVKITGKEDFCRDLLKSETCCMTIPELELDAGPTTLGGRFTTIEGIIAAMKEQLSTSTAFTGDSADEDTMKRMDKVVSQLDEVLNGTRQVTLVLDDPAGNSYIQSLSDDGLDERLSITKYKRTFEQDDYLGINDMKVENYDVGLEKER